MPQNLETGNPTPASKPENTSTQEHSPAFKRAIGRFLATQSEASENRQYTETPEVNAIEKYNAYTKAVLGFVRNRFLPSKTDPEEVEKLLKMRTTYTKFHSIPHRVASKIKNVALRNIPSDAFHALSRTTAPSETDEITRSLATRAIRARIYKELMHLPKSDKEGRQRLIAEGHERDRIAKDFLNQSELTVNLEELGDQTAKVTILEPNSTAKGKDVPIFLIPGISNDLDSVAGLAQEVAYSGRKITTVAFPDATIGKVTSRFAEAVDKSPNYEPHAAFYEAAIDKLVPEGDFELWGFSTGGPIAAEILNDPKYQARVKNAVLIAPASVVDQSINKSLMPGLAHEVFGFRSTAQRYSFITGAKDKSSTPESEKARAATFAALLKKVSTAMPNLYQGAKVKETGQILVVSQAKDDVTKTEKGKDIFLTNPQAKVISVPDAYHNTAVTEPERVISKIHQFQTTK